MKGLSKQADIIFPLIVIAGCLEVILSTGMFHAYCGKMAMKCKGKEKIFIPAILRGCEIPVRRNMEMQAGK